MEKYLWYEKNMENMKRMKKYDRNNDNDVDGRDRQWLRQKNIVVF